MSLSSLHIYAHTQSDDVAMYSVVDDQPVNPPPYKGQGYMQKVCLERLKLHVTSSINTYIASFWNCSIPEPHIRELLAHPPSRLTASSSAGNTCSSNTTRMRSRRHMFVCRHVADFATSPFHRLATILQVVQLTGRKYSAFRMMSRVFLPCLGLHSPAQTYN